MAKKSKKALEPDPNAEFEPVPEVSEGLEGAELAKGAEPIEAAEEVKKAPTTADSLLHDIAVFGTMSEEIGDIQSTRIAKLLYKVVKLFK